MKITFSLSCAACILLFFSRVGQNVMFYIGLSVVGFSFGSIMGIYPGYTARQFGRRNNSVNYGIMFIGFALAGLFGPMIMNMIYGSIGKYQPAFLVSAVLGVVGLILVFILDPKKKTK